MSGFKSSALIVSEKATPVTPSNPGEISVVARDGKLYKFDGITEVEIGAGSVDLTPYTLLSTTASISGDLQAQIDAIPGTSSSKMSSVIATRSTSQAIPHNTWTVMDFNIIKSDPDNTVTTGAAWKFTAPHAGKYLCTFNVLYIYNITWGIYSRLWNRLVHYNSIGTVLDAKHTQGLVELNTTDPDGVYRCPPTISCVFSMAAGDYIQPGILQLRGSTTNTHNSTYYNFISIVEVEA